ncbi:hypothetical protein CRUP_011157 [Coryphaenoides rupestris]|nr:hypothetical protein CRUP_011157 [Coryphaenoides rupestris]
METLYRLNKPRRAFDPFAAETPGSCGLLCMVRRYPVFLGRAHPSALRQELHIQTVLQVNRTLYIGARDDLYRVELDNMAGDEMFYSKKRTWESNKNDIRVCRMKGKHELGAGETRLHAVPSSKTPEQRQASG